MNSFLDNICSTKDFMDHEHYSELLRYLVSCAINNETPKEICIALEVFGKTKDYDPALDSTVRVYVHNLRKKLQHYYRHEGKNDCIKLSIPKGHYRVEFEERQPPSPNNNSRNHIIPFIAIAILSLLVIWLIINPANKNLAYKKSDVWGDIIKNGLNTKIVLGDHYFFKGHIEGYTWNIRDIRINSDEEFESFIENNNISNATFYKYVKSYFPTRIPWCFANLAPIFILNHIPMELRIASKFQWNEIRDENIVYVGSFRGMGFMLHLLENRFKYIDEDGYHLKQELIVLSDSTNIKRRFVASDSDEYPMVDYALVTKIPGPNNNTIYFFLSTHDIGGIEITSLFADRTFLKQFDKEYLKKNNCNYFEAIFKVKGYLHSSMEHELVYFNPVYTE